VPVRQDERVGWSILQDRLDGSAGVFAARQQDKAGQMGGEVGGPAGEEQAGQQRAKDDRRREPARDPHGDRCEQRQGDVGGHLVLHCLRCAVGQSDKGVDGKTAQQQQRQAAVAPEKQHPPQSGGRQ